MNDYKSMSCHRYRSVLITLPRQGLRVCVASSRRLPRSLAGLTACCLAKVIRELAITKTDAVPDWRHPVRQTCRVDGPWPLPSCLKWPTAAVPGPPVVPVVVDGPCPTLLASPLACALQLWWRAGRCGPARERSWPDQPVEPKAWPRLCPSAVGDVHVAGVVGRGLPLTAKNGRSVPSVLVPCVARPVKTSISLPARDAVRTWCCLVVFVGNAVKSGAERLDAAVESKAPARWVLR